LEVIFLPTDATAPSGPEPSHYRAFTIILRHTTLGIKAIETIKISKNVPRTITIHTDSRINLDFLKNKKNRNHLIDEIRKKTITLEKENWNIEYTWIKAHAGHYGKELADKLAKVATRNSDICYNKFPKSDKEHQEREKSMEKWQQQRDHTT
jgi:ribonuclease HI